jgi:hypothetical protein
MEWIKKGVIFNPKNKFSWMKSYASLPIADKIDDGRFRIFFTSRNSKNYSLIGYVEIDIQNPTKILDISKKPILLPGRLGTFDDSGVMAASIVNHKNKKYLYYIGWNQGKNIPFRWAIGLAIGDSKGKKFKKISEGPILERDIVDPYFVSSPTVIKEKNVWKMWYISGTKWEKHKGNLRNPYCLKYAESSDGIKWKRKDIVSLGFKNKSENRIGRASVLKEKEKYKMWYSYAGKSYRIGYAESSDGIKWKRKDAKVGINVSKKGWDSEMIEYSYVFKHKNQLYMLYNGNNYGQTGFGYAMLKK